MTPLTDVSSANGAPMGRPNSIADPNFPVVFEIELLQWVDGDYDQGGAYWGRSDRESHIYRAEGESEDAVERIFVRATSMGAAKAKIRETYPNATFAASADLEAFLSAYIEAALWSSYNSRHEDDPGNEAEMLDDSGYDLAASTRQTMREDCADFLADCGNLIARATAIRSSYTIESAGRDFWLTRNGHGAGFWDRGLGDVGDQLTAACRPYGSVDLIVGDDDLIYS